jgi:hypothetical protein
MSEWPEAKEARLGVIIFQGINDRDDAGDPDAEDSAAIALNVLGLKPVKTPMSEVRQQSGGITIAPKAKWRDFKVKFDRFMVEPSDAQQDFSDWLQLEEIFETYKYINLVSCTLARPASDGDDEWSEEVNYIVEPIEITTSENFEQGEDMYEVTFRQNY